MKTYFFSGVPTLLEQSQLVTCGGHLAAPPLLVPDRRDHIDAAELRNRCRRAGIQVGTADVLLAQLCIHHDLTMLTTDGDFRQIARQAKFRMWSEVSSRH